LKNSKPTGTITRICSGNSIEYFRKNKYTINEVAFMVGFEEPAYFSACFKKNSHIITPHTPTPSSLFFFASGKGSLPTNCFLGASGDKTRSTSRLEV
jgi:hypothetical protein